MLETMLYMVGSGAIAGAMAIAGSRVQIQHLIQDAQQVNRELKNQRDEIHRVDKTADRAAGMAKRAHERLDKAEAPS